jgi:hypothetical protein
MLRHFIGVLFCLTGCFLLVWNAVQHAALTDDEQIGVVITGVFSSVVGASLVCW